MLKMKWLTVNLERVTMQQLKEFEGKNIIFMNRIAKALI